jgi:hypothetical protein
MSAPDTTVPDGINGPAVVETVPEGLADVCFLDAGGQLVPGDYMLVADWSLAAGSTRWAFQPCGPHPAPVVATAVQFDAGGVSDLSLAPPTSSTVLQPVVQPVVQDLPVTGGLENVLLVAGVVLVAAGAGLLRLVRL